MRYRIISYVMLNIFVVTIESLDVKKAADLRNDI